MASVRCGSISTPGRNPACAENKNPTAGSRRWGENHLDVHQTPTAARLSSSASKESRRFGTNITGKRLDVSNPAVKRILAGEAI